MRQPNLLEESGMVSRIAVPTTGIAACSLAWPLPERRVCHLTEVVLQPWKTLRVSNGMLGCLPWFALNSSRELKVMALTTLGPSPPRLRMMLTAEL